MTPITAAVVRQKGGPWALEAVELDAPREQEVLVRVVATGICHTDLSIRDQYLPLRMPIVLGHEGAGIVERVGNGVVGVKPGDRVVMTPMSCGYCAKCQSGLPMYCGDFLRLNIGLRRPDGSATLRSATGELSGCFFGQSSFATHALAHARNVVRVPEDLPLELLGPLGCGIQAGAGTILNAVRPPAGSSVAVFGTGAVGLSAILAARLVGCATIVAVDIHESRLQLAQEFGATAAVDNARPDASVEIRKLGGGRGVDFSIDTTAHPIVMRQAVDCLDSPGVCAVVGLAPTGAEFSLDINFVGSGRTVRGVTEGESVPAVMIPRLIELWRQGRFPFDRMIRVYDFADINQAAVDMVSGTTIKPVLRMPASEP